MDNEYLKNIMGSPYVEESSLQCLKTKIKRINEIIHYWEPPPAWGTPSSGGMGSPAPTPPPAEPTPAEPTPAVPTPTPTAVPTPTAAPTPTPASHEKQVANDFIFIVANTIRIISDEVQEDVKHSADYFAKPIGQVGTGSGYKHAGSYYLPTTWDEPAPTEHEWGYVQDEPIAGQKINPDTHLPEPIQVPKKGWVYRYIKNTDGTRGYKYLPRVPVPRVTPPSTTPPITPPITEIDEPEDTSDTTIGGGADPAGRARANADTLASTEDEPETGKFVYDFASLWRKFPTSHTKEVTDGAGQVIQLPSGKDKILRVFWKWNQHQNIILIRIRNNSEDDTKWEQADILKFYDDQVNPRSPSYNFKIGEFMNAVDRRMNKFFSVADPEIRKQLTDQIERFKPSVYAVIRRKGSMEFRSERHDAFGLYIPRGREDINNEKYGVIITGRSAYGIPKGTELTPETVKNIYWKKLDRQKGKPDLWQSLEGIKYFETFRPKLSAIGFQESDRYSTPAMRDAIGQLVGRGYSQADSTNYVNDAIDDKDGVHDTGDVDQFVKYALKKIGKSPGDSTPPESRKPETGTPKPEKTAAVSGELPTDAKTAISELRKLNVKEDVAITTIKDIIKEKGDKLSYDEYLNLAKIKLRIDDDSGEPTIESMKSFKIINPFQKSNFL